MGAEAANPFASVWFEVWGVLRLDMNYQAGRSPPRQTWTSNRNPSQGTDAPWGLGKRGLFGYRCGFDRFNDPSAGSPTETLLRLLLPLGGRV